MTILIMLGLLASNKSETLTFTHACDNSSVVLDALGEELGTPMKPSGSVNDDYFLVRFDDVSVQEALDKIATTLNATWSEKDGIKYLGRTRQQEREDAETGQGYIGDSVRKWVEQRAPKKEYTFEYAEQLINQALPLINDPGGNSWQALQALSDQSPLSRFLTRIVGEIGTDELSGMAMGDSLQYAMLPNASQRSFPRGDALRLLLLENETHQVMIDKTGAIGRLSSSIQGSSLVGPYNFGQFEVDRVKVTFVRDLGEIIVRLSTGTRTFRQTIKIERSQDDTVPIELSGSTAEIEWSDETRQIVEVLMPMMSGLGIKLAVPENLQVLFSDPVENEFLNVFGSKWILDAAVARGLNLVVVLSDDAGFAGMMGVAQEFNEGQMWSMLPMFESSYEFTLEDGWLTFAPERRAEVREIRIDREMVRSSIRQHKSDGGATIDSMAQLVSASDHELSSMFATMIGALGTGDSALLMDGQLLNPDVLRLYNQLSSAQKIQVHKDGAVLPVPQRGAKFTKYMNKLLFGDRSQLQPTPRKDIWPDTPSYRNLGPEGDPFDLLGSGFPRGSVAKFSIIKRDLIYPMPKRPVSPRGHTTKALGDAMAWAEKTQQDESSDYQQFFVRSAQRLVVEFQFPGVGYVYAETQIDRLPDKFEYVPMSGLPQQLRDELTTALAKSREQYKNVNVGGRVIPPQRIEE